VKDSDSVDTGNGDSVNFNGRWIHDEHHIGRAPLADVLRWSSNIGIVTFSERLSERETFETLRDFGFGTLTGVPYPESNGTLFPPKVWSKQSANSMAMGYEIAVTPLQLAVAYATFANGGILVEPALVKEIRGPDGSVKYRHSTRTVRRVMSQPVADKIRHMLLDVVDEGTALQAALDNYRLAGKTGTPRGSVRGHYVRGRYNPNFVGLFPGDAPQYVIVVKLTAPQTSIFAAQTAAPVSKAILQAAIAARDAALDRGKLASSRVPSAKDFPPTGAPRDSTSGATNPPPDARVGEGAVPFVVTLPMQQPPPPIRTIKPVPDVRGLSLRDAVRSLHSAGFRVQLSTGGGGAASTTPGAGELAPTGTLIRLLFNH
jgi:cell division protein FtsI (penicillin-binding protein 3)